MSGVLFLVADKNMEYALRGFLERKESQRASGIEPFPWEIKVAALERDPGLFKRAAALLQPFSGRFDHAVIVVDAEWGGSPGAESIRMALDRHLAEAGWPDLKGLGLVIEPEVDVWLWTDTPHTAAALGWASPAELRQSLTDRGLWPPEASKPSQPKEAAEWALRQARRPRSSDVYQAVSSRVALDRCADPAAQRLLARLRSWYPAKVPKRPAGMKGTLVPLETPARQSS